MRRAVIRFALGGAVLLCLATPRQAEAQDAASGPLQLREVFEAVSLRHPQSEIAELEVERAKAAQLTARGGWDPKLKATSYNVGLGYYQYSSLDVAVTQATPLWGLGLFAGYRGAWGKLPIYRLERATLPAGEFRVGAQLPIWKDRSIDSQRADIAARAVEIDQATCSQDSTRRELALSASATFWDWVQAGQEVRIQEELLQWAVERDQGLRDTAALGQIPEIVVIDNQRLVLERRSKLVKAEQTLQEATIKLSLFLRDANNDNVLVSIDRLPEMDLSVIHRIHVEHENDLARAIELRPELCEISRQIEAARIGLRLARNQVAPQIDAQAYLAKDLGTGDPTLQPLEAGAALVVSLPVALRAARGKRKEAETKVASLLAKYRSQADKIRSEVRLAAVKLHAYDKQAELAVSQRSVALSLAAAERERFLQGVSNLVVVNLREIAAANAATSVIEAIADLERAKLAYLLARGEKL